MGESWDVFDQKSRQINADRFSDTCLKKKWKIKWLRKPLDIIFQTAKHAHIHIRRYKIFKALGFSDILNSFYSCACVCVLVTYFCVREYLLSSKLMVNVCFNCSMFYLLSISCCYMDTQWIWSLTFCLL